MSTPTPGPFGTVRSAHGTTVYGPHGVSVAWCAPSATCGGKGKSYAIKSDEAHANAVLFAAAGQLLAACEEALPLMLAEWGEPRPDSRIEGEVCILSLRAAIAKARLA